MCIGVPARITAIHDGLMPMGELEVDGATRTCCLAYVPEAAVGDYVIVANGFAMTVVSAADAAASREAFAQLREAEGRR
ncbi:HypC/HybG/HupF family hydrogenase formation chaperone [Corynebacterium sp.]|uniref:HypC/HybG/HupF family hydrogenase formation chaperone n=1 Tax=Corynebacterium sp. TaxID=1720 RepID=UPI0026DB5E76|nr:HypC/HybG/HupF family hydrogenase formation chaperone [Corynebacterium sp.]MDO4609814.1 HypC/HybG/HupF family hydrogenase formation chaperone [Corynebacterium sp.]